MHLIIYVYYLFQQTNNTKERGLDALLSLKGVRRGWERESNRLNHKDLFTYIEEESKKERMVHVAVEESVAFYEVWAFEIES